MSNLVWKCSVAALALVFVGATVEVAEAGGNGKRKQRGGSAQMMRLGGPTANGNGGGAAGGFVDRTGGPSLRTNADIARFFERSRDAQGPN